jgi:hypothetical protein
MTDFNKWYAQEFPDLLTSVDDFRAEFQRAYEAGAASQAGTLRDDFAGQALAGWISSATDHDVYLDPAHYAGMSYEFADAMLEARKTTP